MSELLRFVHVAAGAIGLDGWLAIVPWVAPTMIGVPAIALWTRHYRRKFSREPGRLGEPA